MTIPLFPRAGETTRMEGQSFHRVQDQLVLGGPALSAAGFYTGEEEHRA